MLYLLSYFLPYIFENEAEFFKKNMLFFPKRSGKYLEHRFPASYMPGCCDTIMKKPNQHFANIKPANEQEEKTCLYKGDKKRMSRRENRLNV